MSEVKVRPQRPQSSGARFHEPLDGLGARTPESPDAVRAVRLAVCARAVDAADARDLLAALGLTPGGEEL